MPPIRCLRRLVAGVAAAALAAVAACTHETTAPVSSGSTNPALSLPEANMMGEAVAADAQSELDGATLSSGMFLPGLGAPITPFGAGDGFCMPTRSPRSEEHTSELQSRLHLVCRLLLEKKKKTHNDNTYQREHKLAFHLDIRSGPRTAT